VLGCRELHQCSAHHCREKGDKPRHACVWWVCNHQPTEQGLAPLKDFVLILGPLGGGLLPDLTLPSCLPPGMAPLSLQDVQTQPRCCPSPNCYSTGQNTAERLRSRGMAAGLDSLRLPHARLGFSLVALGMSSGVVPSEICITNRIG